MSAKRPMIGITPGLSDTQTFLTIYRASLDGLSEAGATPVLLPLTGNEEILSDCINRLDGFLFSGGGDIDPLRFGQLQKPGCGTISPLRDECELTLAKLLLARRDKPVLGICRGVQVLSVAAGGDIYQDLPSDYPGQLIAHRQKQPEDYPSHPVTVSSGSLLHRITGHDELLVNSLHHQAISSAGDGFTVSACAPDGVIEAIERTDHRFFLGVQWHPERMWRTDPASMAIFRSFVAACID